VNVQGRLAAASLATQAPGGKIVATRFIRLMPPACQVGAEPASMQAVPSVRIPADSTGLPVKSFLLFKQKTQMVRCGLVRLKIADVFPSGRESQHGCWLRARFARTLPRARPGSLEE